MCVCLASSCSLVCVSCQAMNEIMSKLRSKCTYLNDTVEMFVCATPSCHVMLAQPFMYVRVFQKTFPCVYRFFLDQLNASLENVCITVNFLRQ